MLTNFTTVWCFYNNFYIIIIYLLLSNLHFIFYQVRAPEPGHSRLIDPGHNRIKVKVKVCRDSSASIELTRYLGYQADIESTASAFSSVGKHADNRRHTDIANFAFAESRNVVILACDN